jgi:tellurite resistance protein TerC
VLFWGVVGALAMRGMMIGAGAALVARFSWMTYVFGGLLLFTAARMLVVHHDSLQPEKSPTIRLARRFLPIADVQHGGRFTVVRDGRRMVTPLLLVLLLVETTDLLFAVDSIPAVFAITSDPFIVHTSNVFAILGLRSAVAELCVVERDHGAACGTATNEPVAVVRGASRGTWRSSQPSMEPSAR